MRFHNSPACVDFAPLRVIVTLNKTQELKKCGLEGTLQGPPLSFTNGELEQKFVKRCVLAC